jgi:hypothetical protein
LGLARSVEFNSLSERDNFKMAGCNLSSSEIGKKEELQKAIAPLVLVLVPGELL